MNHPESFKATSGNCCAISAGPATAAYVFTFKGVGEKAKLNTRFLQRKVREYEMLKGEIEKLRQDVSERS